MVWSACVLHGLMIATGEAIIRCEDRLWSEFWARGDTHVARHEHVATHDNDLLGPKEGLWIFCGSYGQVGERANRGDCNSVWLILTQKAQDLLVAWFLRRREQCVLAAGLFLQFLLLGIASGVEQMLPGISWREVRVLVSVSHCRRGNVKRKSLTLSDMPPSPSVPSC
jgi:hypothetical protein